MLGGDKALREMASRFIFCPEQKFKVDRGGSTACDWSAPRNTPTTHAISGLASPNMLQPHRTSQLPRWKKKI